MDDGSDGWLNFRAPEAMQQAVEELAGRHEITKSDLLRNSVEFMLETQADQLAEATRIENQIEEIIEENQQRKKIANWRSHVREQFASYVRDDMDPRGLESVAYGWRQQAAKMEELARTIPKAPPVQDGELVRIIDEELAYAIEAVDLSTWYDRVENPHAAHLSGVEDGENDRRDLAALVEGVVRTHGYLYDAVNDPDRISPVDPGDLPPKCDTLLPDGVTREDVAELATELARSGVDADDVQDVLKDGALPVPSDVEQDGGQEIEALPTGRDDDTREQMVTVQADEATQQELMQAIATADGGRSPGARAAGFNEDTDMTGNTTDTDDEAQIDDYDDPDDAHDVLEELAEAEEVRADE